MTLSHRTRLAAVATGAAGLLLATLFAAVTWISTRADQGRAQRELESAQLLLTQEGDPSREFGELRGSHPLVSATLFDAMGARTAGTGRLVLESTKGLHRQGDLLVLGRPWRDGALVAGIDLRAASASSRQLGVVLALLWLPLSLLVGAATWLAARAVFRPLLRMSAQAATMEGSDLGERLSTDDPAEFGEFARQLNAMLDRIQQTLEREERFAVDAAHELRTPLALMLTRLETTRLRSRSAKEYEATNEELLKEVRRMADTVEALLRTARANVGPAPTVNLGQVVPTLVEPWRHRLGDDALRFENSPATDPDLAVAMEVDELRIVLDNLLDNAVRFSPSGGRIDVRLGREGDRAVLVVVDDGPGIPPAFHEKVFGRFVRVDDSRNRASGGAGVGLAVCRQLVESRGGTIVVQPSDRGAALRVELPLLDIPPA